MKKLYALLSAALLLLGLLSGCAGKVEAPVPNVGFLGYESYMLNFTVEEDTVQVRCVLSLVNQGTQVARIRLYGDFPNDVGKLLQEERLTGVIAASGEEIITLNPGTVRQVGVIFTGTFAGNAVKHDRLLPVLCWEDADNPGQVRELQAYARNNRN